MSPLRTALALVVVALCTGCPKRVAEQPVKAGPPRPYQLLAEAAEQETTQLKDVRSDLEVESRELERTPRVVAVGETPLIKLEGARATLAGDEGGKKEWSVDNFVLIEVLSSRGEVLNRAVIGHVPDGVMHGRERLDNLGRMGFSFEAGEIDLTGKLPEAEPFKLRATALDYGGVGRASDLFLILAHTGRRGGGDDDLRGQ